MSAIYLKQGDSLAEMVETPYEAESLLQELIADYPNLLAGDQDDLARRRWLLVKRELGIASEEEGPNRWSLDHLFLDQDGIPTLVEVKRSSDTRIRREVVGQLLDYAANGAAVWDQEKIRASFEQGREQNGENPQAVLDGFLGTETDSDKFWERVGTNLSAGRLRLVFVADKIPSELRRIVEFLNEQMKRTEVLALEVVQYKERGGERTTLVPRLIGQTEAARQAKGSTPKAAKTQWDEESYESAIAAECGKDSAFRVMALFRRLRDHGANVFYGTGTTYPSLNLWLGQDNNPGEPNPVAVSFYPTGVAVNLDFVRNKRSESEMERLVELICEIPGVSPYFKNLDQAPTKWGMRPTMDPKAVLADDEAVGLFASKLIEAAQPARS